MRNAFGEMQKDQFAAFSIESNSTSKINELFAPIFVKVKGSVLDNGKFQPDLLPRGCG